MRAHSLFPSLTRTLSLLPLTRIMPCKQIIFLNFKKHLRQLLPPQAFLIFCSHLIQSTSPSSMTEDSRCFHRTFSLHSLIIPWCRPFAPHLSFFSSSLEFLYITLFLGTFIPEKYLNIFDRVMSQRVADLKWLFKVTYLMWHSEDQTEPCGNRLFILPPPSYSLVFQSFFWLVSIEAYLLCFFGFVFVISNAALSLHLLNFSKPFRCSSMRHELILRNYKYPGNFSIKLFALHILLSVALVKTQACKSGKMLDGRSSKDFGSFKKDICGISGLAGIRKCRITHRETSSCTISNNKPPSPHPESFLQPHIPTPSPNTGFCRVKALDSSHKVQTRLQVNPAFCSLLISSNEYQAVCVQVVWVTE